MSAGDRGDGTPGLLGDLGIAPIGVEHLSAIRYLHVSAFRSQAAAFYGEAEVATFELVVRSPAYSEALLADRVFGAFIGGELIATAGWGPASDGSESVRLRAVYVSPFFTRLGVGRQLVAAVERDGERAGYRVFSVRCTLNAVGFLQRLGYGISSHGVRQLTPAVGLAVTFMRKPALEKGGGSGLCARAGQSGQ